MRCRTVVRSIIHCLFLIVLAVASFPVFPEWGKATHLIKNFELRIKNFRIPKRRNLQIFKFSNLQMTKSLYSFVLTLYSIFLLLISCYLLLTVIQRFRCCCMAFICSRWAASRRARKPDFLAGLAFLASSLANSFFSSMQRRKM